MLARLSSLLLLLSGANAGCAVESAELTCESAAELLVDCAVASEDPACADDSEPARLVNGPECSGAGKADFFFADRGNGDDCKWSWQCASDEGLICRTDSRWGGEPYQASKRCRPLGEGGDLCDDNDECADGLSCLPLDEQRVTETYPWYYSLISGSIDTYSYMVWLGVCAAPSDEDGDCDQDADCVGELVCNIGPYTDGLGRCRSGGETCTFDLECSDNLVCRPYTSPSVGDTCQGLGAEGELCGEDADCIPLFECNGKVDGRGHCEPRADG